MPWRPCKPWKLKRSQTPVDPDGVPWCGKKPPSVPFHSRFTTGNYLFVADQQGSCPRPESGVSSAQVAPYPRTIRATSEDRQRLFNVRLPSLSFSRFPWPAPYSETWSRRWYIAHRNGDVSLIAVGCTVALHACALLSERRDVGTKIRRVEKNKVLCKVF